MTDIWPLTFENMWLPMEVWYDLKFLWWNRLGPKNQFLVPLQHIYELIGDQIPTFPLTLHWNQNYQKAQVTISVNLHLKLLSLNFPRRQKQCPRSLIDSLDNRCPWLDWQMTLKLKVHFVPKMHRKCTWPKKCGDFEFWIATLSEFYKEAILAMCSSCDQHRAVFTFLPLKNPRWWTCQ